MTTNNGGVPGQVIISWFTPIEASLEGSGYTNEVYIMVVNALTSNTGSETNCPAGKSIEFRVRQQRDFQRGND